MNASPALNLVVLRSADLERAAAFYREIGLIFTRHSHGSGPEHLSATTDGLVFELYPATPKFPPTIGTRVGFRVDDVDRIVNALAQLGAAIVSEPKASEWGRRAVLKDFDGHPVELITAA